MLVVDQFEEVFNSTRDEDERIQFIELLGEQVDGLKVVLAMRADYYGHCAAYPTLARLIGNNQVLVGSLTPLELAAVIENPAARVGLRVEPELTRTLLADLGSEPGALPLLSTALLELWQERERGWLTLSAYRASGGVHGAVARLAENAYGSLTDEQRPLARSILLRLTGVGEGSGVVRRRVPLSEFDPQNHEATATVLERLTDARLLTAGDGFIEVAHEALLREWPRLQQWLEEDAAGRQVRLHLIGAAHDWDARGREPGDLYRGARLAAALDWTAQHGADLNALERDFIDQSRQASESEITRQRRTNRRLRALLAAVGVFLLIAIGTGALAAYQAGIAGQASRLARSRELAASAIAVRDQDPTLSKLLALESASIADPPVESVASLHRAWDSDRIVYRYSLPTDPDASSVDADLDPTARYIAVGSDGPKGHVEVVDRQESKTLWSFAPQIESTRLSRPVFTPDGSRIVFGAYFDDMPPAGASADDVGVHVRDAVTGAEILHIATGDCGALVFAASNRTAIVATSTGEFCVRLRGISVRRDIVLESVDLESGARTTLTATMAGNDEQSVSSDGSTVVFQAFDGANGPNQVAIKDLDTGKRSTLDLDGAAVHDVSADGKLALVDHDGKLQLWDVDAGEAVGDGFAPDPITHSAYAQFAPDGRSVFSTGGDGLLHQWDLDSGEELLSYPAAGGRPSPSAGGLVLLPSSEPAGALLIDTSLRAEVRAIDANVVASSSPAGGECSANAPGSTIDAAGAFLLARHSLPSRSGLASDGHDDGP